MNDNAGIYKYELQEKILVVSNVSFAYGVDGPRILDNLSFEIRNVVRPDAPFPQGQIVTLLGPSGIGKSTLLRILAGQLNLEEGSGAVEMLTNQGDAIMQPVTEGGVGVVYQNYILFSHMRVRRLLEMAARFIPKSERRDRIDAILEDLRLKDHQDKFSDELSGGQRQRVSIAQQLLLGRQIVILDEPFSGLDYAAKTRVANMLQKVAQRHELQTLIVITHDIDSAVSISDTVLVLGRTSGAQGASIIKTVDLMERGIAWRPDNALQPEFAQVVAELKQLFLKI